MMYRRAALSFSIYFVLPTICLSVHANEESNPIPCQSGLTGLSERAPNEAKADESQTIASALQTLATHIPRMLQMMRPGYERTYWMTLKDTYLGPAMESNLVALGMVGAGNTGKSTLMNYFPRLLHLRADQIKVSAANIASGLTRRITVALSPKNFDKSSVRDNLHRRFGWIIPWRSEMDSVAEGPALLFRMEGLPENFALIDSPDFDTADASVLLAKNRKVAEQVFRTAEILMIVLTPFHYQHLGDLAFLRDILREIGSRKLILIYRTYESISDEEVLSHLKKALEGICCGTSIDTETQFPVEVIGAYRMPDKPEVAAGEAPIELHRLNGFPEFSELIWDIDRRSETIKREVFEKALEQVLEGASEDFRWIERASYKAEIEQMVLDHVQTQTAESVVGNFPLEELLNIVEKKWSDLMPTPVRYSREVANLLTSPSVVYKRVKHLLVHLLPLHRSEEEAWLAVRKELLRRRIEESILLLERQLSSGEFSVRFASEEQERKKEFLEKFKKFKEKFHLGPSDLPIWEEGEGGVEVKLDPAHFQRQNTFRGNINLRNDILAAMMERDERMGALIETTLMELRSARGRMARMKEAVLPFLSLLPIAGAIASFVMTSEFTFRQIQHFSLAYTLTKVLSALERRGFKRQVGAALTKRFKELRIPPVVKLLEKEGGLEKLRSSLQSIPLPSNQFVKLVSDALEFLKAQLRDGNHSLSSK